MEPSALGSRKTCRDVNTTPYHETRPQPLRHLHPQKKRKPHITVRLSWQERQDLNLRPTVLETVALPTELHSYEQCSL